MTNEELEQLSINTIRTLSIDAVQQAKSGHPGTPMALAPLVYTVWNRVMNFDPQDPIWPNRDRFVLSNGHASMLLWSILHLTGVQAVNADYELLGQPSVTLDDIRRFAEGLGQVFDLLYQRAECPKFSPPLLGVTTMAIVSIALAFGAAGALTTSMHSAPRSAVDRGSSDSRSRMGRWNLPG